MRFTGGIEASKSVTVHAGAEVAGIDFDIPLATESATISGRVLDEDRQPMAGVLVQLIAREHEYGVLRYGQRDQATTNDRGEYVLRPEPNLGTYSYVIGARSAEIRLDASARPQPDPKQRKKVFAPSYYPNSTSIEGAALVSVRPGTHLEGMDIRAAYVPGYCVSGTLTSAGVPGPVGFEFSTEHPANGMGSMRTMPNGKAGPDGRFCICDVPPGRYRLAASSRVAGANSRLLGKAMVDVTDSDVRNVRVDAEPGNHLGGQVVWKDQQPVQPPDSSIRVDLESLTGVTGARATSSIPGSFSFSDVFLDHYGVRVSGLPSDLYVADVTYGGVSVLNGGMHYGAAIAGAELRVVVARDGGTISARVVDSKGSPIPDASVYLMPADSVSDADLSVFLKTGQTNEDGVYTSSALRPGKYYVLALNTELRKTPEGMRALRLARSRAKEVEVGPGSGATVTIERTSID